jgi:hypothetical protein
MSQKKSRKPWNQQNTAEKVGTVIQMTLGVVVLLACCIGGIAAVVNNNQATQTLNAQDTATTVSDYATQVVQALTPSPTPTLVHRITDIVTHHKPDWGGCCRLAGVITGAKQSGNSLRVDVTENSASWNASSTDSIVRQDTYDVLDALYSKGSGFNPDQVEVRTFGPCTDKYGNTDTCQWADALLTKQTETLFNWSNLDPPDAWNDYDSAQYLVGGL